MINPNDVLNAQILVVDDCLDNISLISDILRIAGYTRVSSLTDSRKVCAAHAEHDYDLVVLDMHMPGLNGLEVMAGLKKIEKYAYLPVLAITGDSGYKIAALEAGARDFITKPYDCLEFQKRVYNMLEVRLLYKTVAEQSRVQEEMALHDHLTGLSNRRLLVDRIQKAMQHANRSRQLMAVMYMDIDGFKTVNDLYGHQCGDTLLKMVAERLLGATREEDTVARIGGDEFIMVLSDIAGVSDVLHPASNLLHSLARPYHIDGVSVRVSASIGIAIYPFDANNVDTLISLADKALYEAKKSGKNRYHFVDLAAFSNPPE